MSSKRQVKVNIQYHGHLEVGEQQGLYKVGSSYGGPACLPVEVMGLLPLHDYKVEYIEDPIGEFVIAGFGGQLALVAGPVKRAYICFLPLDWPIGLRLRRVVS